MQELVNRLYALYRDAVGVAENESCQDDSVAGHSYLMAHAGVFTLEVSVLGHRAIVSVIGPGKGRKIDFEVSETFETDLSGNCVKMFLTDILGNFGEVSR